MFRRKIFTISMLALLVGYACNNDDGPNGSDFDHVAQSTIDNDSIVLFLQNHYFDDAIDSIQPLVSGATALFNDSRLMVQDVTESEVDYKLYYFVKNVGNPDPVKGFPSRVDSVLTKYHGLYLAKTDSLVEFEKPFNAAWFTLHATITGWSHGFSNFKGGRNITNNGPITYENGGEGILIIPSGLGYRDIGSSDAVDGSIIIPANTPLIFYINLFDIVENTDHDLDGVPSIDEDLDGDGDPRNDDTDGDLFANFLDLDDDNDGILSIDEDTNGNGDPRDDDTDGDGIPNFLDEDS